MLSRMSLDVGGYSAKDIGRRAAQYCAAAVKDLTVAKRLANITTGAKFVAMRYEDVAKDTLASAEKTYK